MPFASACTLMGKVTDPTGILSVPETSVRTKEVDRHMPVLLTLKRYTLAMLTAEPPRLSTQTNRVTEPDWQERLHVEFVGTMFSETACWSRWPILVMTLL